jgi:N4-gp56 family major capsid protein
MVDAFTDVGSGASLGLNLVKTAYDKALDFELRSEPLYRQAVSVRKIQELTQPGETVVFNLYNYMDPLANSDLSETAPASARAVPSTDTVSVTIREFGDVVIPTWRLRTYSFADVDRAIAQIVAATAADDVDARVRTALLAGANVLRSDAGAPSTTQTTANIGVDDVFSSRLVRSTVAKLRGASAVPVKGNYYAAYVHPDQSLDLQAETGAAGWREPHAYSAPGNIWAGEIGSYQGAFFVESPRVYNVRDGIDKDGAGAGTQLASVYRSHFLGAQGLAEAVSEEVNITIGPVTDPHNRHRPLGYHGAAGWSIYRENAVWRVETGSSNDL